MTAFQIYGFYIAPLVLLVVAGGAAWLLVRRDRAEADRQRQR
jgi:hypothetical protein